MNTSFDPRAGSRRGLLLIVLAAVLWGTVGVTTKYIYGIAETNALSIGFFRLAFSTPTLLVACTVTLGRRAFRIAPRDLLGGVLLALGSALGYTE
ncbi:MAG TPA: EamA family transporter [Roseiflexaceae bacterium]